MRIKIGVLFACLAMAFGAPGCAERPKAEDQTERASSELVTDGTTAAAKCNGRDPGLPVPISREDEFFACTSACEIGPPPRNPGNCHRECCTAITGCGQCFIQ